MVNAASGAIYGTGPLRSVQDAFVKGALSGAVSGGVNNLLGIGKGSGTIAAPTRTKASALLGGGVSAPTINKRDPKAGCLTQKPFSGTIGTSGYGYGNANRGNYATRSVKRDRFDLGSFVKDVVVGAVVGGTASVAFYGADKAATAIGNGVKRAAARGAALLKDVMDGNRSRVQGSGSSGVANGRPLLRYDLQYFAGKNGGEVTYPTEKTHENARNTLMALADETDAFANGSVQYYGRLESSYGYDKQIGRQSLDGKVRWRLDYDPEKGVHYNFEDFSTGKGNKATKIAIPIDISYEQFTKIIDWFNS